MLKKIVLALTFLFCSTVLAGEIIGNVTEITGQAFIRRGKESIPVVKNIGIETNDKVETKNGDVKITFKDSTTVKITPGSSLVIDDFIYDPKSSSGKLNLKAASGTVRYVSGAIAHSNPNAVNIKTPTAAIAVRGTDFIMSVNEIGESMIILMPNCDDCGSGEIDVASGTTTVNLNQPFQATMVETIGAAPSPPLLITLFNTPIGNNLQVSPPRTLNGVNLVIAARSAAEKTGDIKRAQAATIDSTPEQMSVAAQDKSTNRTKDASSFIETQILVNPDSLAQQAAASTKTEIPYLFILWKDKLETQQIGWLYEVLSYNQHNYTNITIPNESRIQITVTQDMLTESYNFMPDNGKPQGRIVINQTYR